MSYCSDCGEKRNKVIKENAFGDFPYRLFCPKGHSCLSRDEKLNYCEEGFKELRTKDKNGFQTVCVPNSLNLPQDMDYFVASIISGFQELTEFIKHE